MKKKKNGLNAGILLIGIGVLAFTNFWWPGIMFVLGLSSLASGGILPAVWLIGIGTVAYFNAWWPGMMFVVGAGIIAEAALGRKRYWGSADNEDIDSFEPPEFPPPERRPPPPARERVESTPPPPPAQPASSPTADTRWVPATCPYCGAPINATNVKYHDDHKDRANCPWCEQVIEKE
jgi:hypothetical protein